jgi:hypothetical protein
MSILGCPRRLKSSDLSGFCPRACFCRIEPATWANDAPLETATNRSAPMACGPNVDQARRRHSPPRVNQGLGKVPKCLVSGFPKVNSGLPVKGRVG